MSGIGTLFEIGKRALFSYKAALDVVGHNVANIDTPGYSRQEAVLESVSYSFGQGGPSVGGVNVAEVKRSYSDFLDAQINQQMQSQGKWEVIKDGMDQVEMIFNESTGQGLGSVMEEFWGAWQEVINKPEGMAERANLSSRAETVADVLKRLQGQLGQVQSYADRGILGAVGAVNSLSSRIAGINQRIIAVEAGGQGANDLRDQRDQLLQQLADKMDMSYFEAQDGSVSVYSAGGVPLVEGNSAQELQTVSGENGLHQVEWVGPGGQRVDVTDKLSNGALGGWIELRDSIIPEYKGKLDQLASTLMKEVNRLHSSGVGLTPFQTLTAGSAVADEAAAITSSDSGLPFYSEVKDGSFQVWVYDNTGALAASQAVNVGSATSLQDLQGALNGITGINASISGDGKLEINAQSGWSFHVSNDTSGALMALGLNTMFTGSDAGDISLNESIRRDPNQIAAATASDGTGIAAGNGLNAISIAGLQDSLLMENGAMSMSSFHQSMVASIGIESADAQNYTEYQEAILGQLNNRRQEVSGVSLDEEVVNLMEYSRAYSAAARLITTAQEMLDTLLQLK